MQRPDRSAPFVESRYFASFFATQSPLQKSFQALTALRAGEVGRMLILKIHKEPDRPSKLFSAPPTESLYGRN